MPKHKDEVWRQYHKTNLGNGKNGVKCKYCVFKLSCPNVTRMFNHLHKECKHIPSDVKSSVVMTYSSTSSRSESEDDLVSEAGPSSVSHNISSNNKSKGKHKHVNITTCLKGFPAEFFLVFIAKKFLKSNFNILFTVVGGTSTSPTPTPTKVFDINRRKQGMGFYVDTMSEKEQEHSAAAFARALFVSNFLHSTFEHPVWKEAFKNIRPAFKPPSKYLVGSRYLDREYESVQTGVQQKIEDASCVSLSADGWTNNRGEHLINFVVCTPEPVFF